MPITLNEIVANKYKEVAERKTKLSPAALEETLQPLQPGAFEDALKASTSTDPSLILEIKPASPSGGVLTETLDLEALLAVYNQYARALSVLTDTRFFRGSLGLLKTVGEKSPHPRLCKDFIIDSYQIAEACQAGATAVLLIVKILDDQQLFELYQAAHRWGLTPVLEVQNEAELQRALQLDPTVLLINNRNLDTFEISFETTKQLVPLIPPDKIVISASGIESRQDIETLSPYTTCFLIGSSLMKTPVSGLKQKLQELIGA